MSVKITDLVPQETIDKIKELDGEIKTLLDTYTNTARELAKGVDIKVKVIGDIDKLEKLLVDKAKEATATTERLNEVIAEQGRVMNDTTPVIARRLAEQERVNKTQREAYTEHDRVKKLLDQLLGSYNSHVQQMVKLTAAIEENKHAQAANRRALENGRISAEQFFATQTELTASYRALSQEKRTLNQIMTAEEKAAQATDNGYAQMSQHLELLKKAYKDMCIEAKSSPFGKEIEASIQSLDAHLKDLAADMGEHQRNVGNYAIAGQSIKKDLKDLVLEIANLSIAYQNLTEEEKKSAKGKELADHIGELTERAGALKDAIGDTNQAIANAASDTRTFDQLGGTLQLAIDGFGLATGAAQMLGISEGELAEVQTKLQAAIAASNAMSKIQNALQSQSAVMQGVNLVQTKLRTAAENIHTAAQGKGVIVTKAATVAQWGFNAAATMNPIGFLVVAITACIAAVYGLTKAFNFFINKTQTSTKELEDNLDQIDRTKKSHEELISVLEKSGASQESVSNSRLSCLNEEHQALSRVIDQAIKNHADEEAIAEARERMDENRLEAQKEYETAYQRLCGMVNEQAAEDLKKRIGEANAKRRLVEQEIAMQRDLIEKMRETAAEYGFTTLQLDEMVDALEKKRKRALEKIAEDEKKAAADRKAKRDKSLSELQKAVEAGEDALLNIITDSIERQQKAEELSYNRKRAALKKSLSETASTNVAMINALNAQIEGLTIQHNTKIAELQQAARDRYLKAEADIIASHLAIVEVGSQEELDYSLQQLENSQTMELRALAKAERNKEITVEQAEEMRANIVLKYAKEREKIEADHAKKVAEIIEQKYSSEQETAAVGHIAAVNALKERYSRELAAAKGNASRQEAVEAQYERELSALNEQYAQQTIRTSIDMLEEILKSEQLSAEDRLKFEKALARAKAELEGAMADASIAQIDRATRVDEEAHQRRMENLQNWKDKATDSLNAITTLFGALYDSQISKIEEVQEVNTAAGEEEIERITQLVEKQVITEEEGEARKRATEAKTARLNEELEKKKQKLKYKQAMWDKVNSIAQAGIATALAIAKALPNVILAALAGAMGAAQIATIVATPIPTYAKGTDNHPGGPAVVGDGGRPEVVLYNGSAWLTPDKPTLVDLPAGAVVVPNVSAGTNPAGLISSGVSSSASQPVIVNNDYTRLEREVVELGRLIKQQTRVQKSIAYLNDHELFKRLI